MSKMIEFKDTLEWLAYNAGGEELIELADVIGILTDVANGIYSWEQVAEDIKDYKEHNE